jgi:hypothetical protein
MIQRAPSRESSTAEEMFDREVLVTEDCTGEFEKSAMVAVVWDSWIRLRKDVEVWDPNRGR